MHKPYIPFLVFVILFLLTIPISHDFATSVVPGWHTTVIPGWHTTIIWMPGFVGSILVSVTLLMIILAYKILSKKIKKISWTIFITHFLLTLLAIILIRFPFFLFNRQLTSSEELQDQWTKTIRIIYLGYALFVVGQIIFFIYFIKIIRQKWTQNK